LLLTKSKPHERVLASVRRRPEVANDPGLADAAPGGPAGPEGAGSSASGPPGTFVVPHTPSYPLIPEPPGTTPITPTPPIAAPEPATWALMLFGLFAVTTMRRHRSMGIT
jgi:hypothetical protein